MAHAGLSRTDAVVMLIKAMGEEEEALSFPKTHPFADVPKWADGYVSYAYENGIAGGVSPTLFGSSEPVSAEMFLTFTLRALGYKDGEDGSFKWNAPWALAARVGLLMPDISGLSFSGEDAGTILKMAFNEEEYPKFRQIDRAITEFIKDHEHATVYSEQSFLMESHMVTEITEKDGILAVSFVIGLIGAGLDENNNIINDDYIDENGIHIIDSYSEITGLWQLDLDAETLEIAYGTGDFVKKSWTMESENQPLSEVFSEKSINALPMFNGSMLGLASLQTRQLCAEYRLWYDE
jgi:hypothetical protein